MSNLSMKKGKLSLKQINLMLSTLPVDLTFVDERDLICYYSQKKDLIFPRNPKIIGTTVQSCHSPQSVPLVNRMIEEFKKGRQDLASFWIKKNKRFVYVRYIAVRDARGKYKGILEVAQDVTKIKRLKGQKKNPVWG